MNISKKEINDKMFFINQENNNQPIAVIKVSDLISKETYHDKWLKRGLCYECSVCHCGCMFTIVDKIVYGKLFYCPNCGTFNGDPI